MYETAIVKLDVDEPSHILLDKMAYASTKLWNISNWNTKQEWDSTGKIPTNYSLQKQLQEEYWYKLLPSHSAQAILKKLYSSYRSWFQLRKEDPTAGPPGFRPKKALSTIIFKKASIRLLDNQLRLSVSKKCRKECRVEMKYLSLPFKYYSNNKLATIQGKIKNVEVTKKRGFWQAHIIYMPKYPPLKKEGGIEAIDVGVVNLATIVDEKGNSEIYTGKGLSSIVRYFNKKIALTQARINGRGKRSSTGLKALYAKRNAQINHVIHSASRDIIKNAVEKDISTIVVGDLKGIKKGDDGKGKKLIKKVKQKINNTPIRLFIQSLKYKAIREGITVVELDERGTSRTCSACGLQRKSNRVHRGLYVCKGCNSVLNADVNGARNILLRYLQEVGKPAIGVVGSLANPLVRRWNYNGFC